MGFVETEEKKAEVKKTPVKKVEKKADVKPVEKSDTPVKKVEEKKLTFDEIHQKLDKKWESKNKKGMDFYPKIIKFLTSKKKIKVVDGIDKKTLGIISTAFKKSEFYIIPDKCLDYYEDHFENAMDRLIVSEGIGSENHYISNKYKMESVLMTQNAKLLPIIKEYSGAFDIVKENYLSFNGIHNYLSLFIKVPLRGKIAFDYLFHTVTNINGVLGDPSERPRRSVIITCLNLLPQITIKELRFSHFIYSAGRTIFNRHLKRVGLKVMSASRFDKYLRGEINLPDVDNMFQFTIEYLEYPPFKCDVISKKKLDVRSYFIMI